MKLCRVPFRGVSKHFGRGVYQTPLTRSVSRQRARWRDAGRLTSAAADFSLARVQSLYPLFAEADEQG